MAQGQLPLYYKNSKLVGPSSTKTKWSEYYLLVVTLFGFLMLFAGVLWFLPSIDADDGYTKAYGGFTGSETSGSVGTESMSPLASNQGVLPTAQPYGNRTGNYSRIALIRQSEPSSSSDEHVLSKSKPAVPTQSSKKSNTAENANTMRRDKVVQVL